MNGLAVSQNFRKRGNNKTKTKKHTTILLFRPQDFTTLTDVWLPQTVKRHYFQPRLMHTVFVRSLAPLAAQRRPFATDVKMLGTIIHATCAEPTMWVATA